VNPRDSRQERLKKLARKIDALAEKDTLLIRQTRDMAELRRRAALELHALCVRFIQSLNQLVTGPPIELDPAAYWPESFQDSGVNLLQINVRGRVLQIEFQATEQILSTENFRVPYTLEGVVRCFNQRLLDQNLVEEQLLFYCVEKDSGHWRFFDARTYRSGPLDQDYLVSVMELVV